MAHELSCPHCGCPLVATQDTVAVETVEARHCEIEHLHVTVARLRGAGGNLLRRVHDANPAPS
ncbi:MAG: hypothetical protein ACRDQ9_07475 [Pseudonocardiaceae bacterium]